VVRVSRDDLDDTVRILVQRTVEVFRRTVRGAGLEVANLDRVLLVGGSSRLPLVSHMLEQRFGVPVAV
jgi:molecular chaperone DnaK (HSP70)